MYIDAFAGTGRCDITVDGEKTCIDGSARRALRVNPPFHAFYFIELKSRKLEALRSLKGEYPGLDIEIVAGDANTALQELCRTYDCKNTRAVLFLDPYGMHVEWPTLEAVARTGAIDVPVPLFGPLPAGRQGRRRDRSDKGRGDHQDSWHGWLAPGLLFTAAAE